MTSQTPVDPSAEASGEPRTSSAERPTAGRPKKPTADLRTNQVRIRLTASEKSRIGRAAGAAGLSASEYLRRRALGQAVVARADVEAVRQLRRVGANLNQLARRANASGTAGLEADVEAALDELRAAVAALLPAADAP